jgi:hypothetical protein
MLLPDLLGPPSSSGRVSTVAQLEQWERLDCLEQWGLIASTAAYSLLPPSTTSISLQTGAAAAAA